jgi:hypothetical protein
MFLAIINKILNLFEKRMSFGVIIDLVNSLTDKDLIWTVEPTSNPNVYLLTAHSVEKFLNPKTGNIVSIKCRAVFENKNSDLNRTMDTVFKKINKDLALVKKATLTQTKGLLCEKS